MDLNDQLTKCEIRTDNKRKGSKWKIQEWSTTIAELGRKGIGINALESIKTDTKKNAYNNWDWCTPIGFQIAISGLNDINIVSIRVDQKNFKSLVLTFFLKLLRLSVFFIFFLLTRREHLAIKISIMIRIDENAVIF